MTRKQVSVFEKPANGARVRIGHHNLGASHLQLVSIHSGTTVQEISLDYDKLFYKFHSLRIGCVLFGIEGESRRTARDAPKC